MKPWIKMEYNTIRKEEVMQIARTLGVSRREAFGMCFEFWCWCDAELSNGHIRGVSLEELDDMVSLPIGFCEAMRQTGWLVLEDTRIVVTNFSKHIGNPAKNRAKHASAQAKYASDASRKGRGRKSLR